MDKYEPRSSLSSENHLKVSKLARVKGILLTHLYAWKEEDERVISRALELTRIQYCEPKGHSVPGDFTEYTYESDAWQWILVRKLALTLLL